MEFEKLQNIIAEVLNIEPDEITMDTTFVEDLGADSLDIFQIINKTAEHLAVDINQRFDVLQVICINIVVKKWEKRHFSDAVLVAFRELTQYRIY